MFLKDQKTNETKIEICDIEKWEKKIEPEDLIY